MTRLTFALLAVYVLLMAFFAAGASADPTPTPGSPKEMERRFRRADQNGDGALSRQEMMQAGWLVEEQDRFNTVDKDLSGTVTLAEIGSAIAAQVQKWLAADTDGDGRVSEMEAHDGSLSATFRHLDDGDGYLTTQELERYGQRSYYETGELPSVAPNIIERHF